MPSTASTHPARILILSGVRGDTRRYRTFHLHQQLRLAGVDAVLSHLTDPALPVYVRQANLVILHRIPYDHYVAALLDRIRRSGGLALMDTDDLTFQPEAFQWIDSPDFRDPVRRSLYQAEMLRQRQTLERCDALLASTDFLAGQVRSLGKLCWVHRNAANLELVSLSDEARRSRTEARFERSAPGETVTIGYASGTPTHNHDFATIAPALQHTLAAFPQTRLWLIGPLDIGPGWTAFENRIQRIPAVPWRSLPALLSRLDINLAPLVLDNPFSQSKSEIKYMEAALVAAPTIASPTAAFQYAIRHGQNGFLAETVEEWQVALASLLDETRRLAVGEQAYRDALRRYAPAVRAQEVVALLNEISAALGSDLRLAAHPPELAASPPPLVER